MCPKFLSSSLLLVYLLGSILYQINGGNLSDAAPLGKNTEEKDNLKPSLIDLMNSKGDDKINLNKYFKLFLRNLLIYDSGYNNDETGAINTIRNNPSMLLEEKVEKIVRDPALHKKLLLQILPHITDTLIGDDNNIDTEGSLTREKRSLLTEKVFTPQDLLAESKTFVSHDEDTVNFFGLELESASGRVWKKAFEKSLDEQNMYNTAASGLVKGVLRWVAWSVFAVMVHGPEHLFSY